MATKYKSSQKQNKKSSKVTKILAVAILTCILIGAFLIIRDSNRQDARDTTTPFTPTESERVNLDPPTEEEIAETEEFKKNLEQGNSAPVPTSEDGLNNVTPIIVSSNKDEVNAYVPGIFEENGMCRAALTKDGITKEFESKGFGNVSNTTCEPIQISGLENGTWSLTVYYESDTSKGVSKAATLEVN